MADIIERGFQGFVRKIKDMTGFFAEVVVDGGGQAGVHTETGTTAVVAATVIPGSTDFTAIQCMADTVFALLTDASASASSDTMTGFTVPAGTTIFGRFTAFTLTSGKVRAYL